MSNQRVATDFDQIIQADRQRRKNEELAKSIFSRKNKKDGFNTKKDNQRNARTPSLASRIGVVKPQRSSSASSNTSPRNPPSRPSSVSQNARVNRLAVEINESQHVNVKPSKNSGPGLSIKGSAAPFVVEARNFAPGTTDADIESAIQGDCMDSSGINTLVSCRIVSTNPVVVAEMVFTERAVADKIIERYHKQKADGKILELRLARSGPGSMSKQIPKPEEPQPLPEPEIVVEEELGMEGLEMEEEVPAADTYDDERQAAERDRKDRESRRADRDEYDGGGKRRDEERRDDRHRDRDDRDRTRDRDYDRREDRSYSHPEERNGRSSHYGNGVGGPRPSYGRGGYGGTGYRGGRPSYNEDSSRGSFGGRGGGGGYQGGRWRGGGPGYH